MAADDYKGWLDINQKRATAMQMALASKKVIFVTPGHVERLDPVVTGHYLHATTRDLPQWNGEWTPSELAEALEPWDGTIFDSTVGERPSQAQVKAAVERLAALIPDEPKCTCGVQHTGGIHSDWCDLEDQRG